MNSKIGEYGVCWCGREIERKVTNMVLSAPGRSVTVDSVPGGICEPCNFRYYKACVVEMLETTLRGEDAPGDHGLPSSGNSAPDGG